MNHDAFLADICAHPHDDGPRLVYADWLEDNGDPGRAEFIRVQCALARLPSGDERRAALLARERDLWQRNRLRAQAELPQLPDMNWGAPLTHASFKRGFAARVEASTLETVRAQRHVFRYRVPVSSLCLKRIRPEEAATLGGPDDPPGLTKLRIRQAVTPEVMRALAASPLAPRLTSLDLAGTRLRLDALTVLLGSTAFAGLRQLCLDGNFLSGPTPFVEALAASPVLANLADLSLESNALGDQEAQLLASSPHLTKLERLELHCDRIGPAGVRAFVEGPDRPHLTHFSLGSNRAGDEGARALASWPALSRFRRLNLANNTLSADFVESWARAGGLAGVDHLQLIECTSRTGELRPAYLSVYNNGLTEEGLSTLLGSPQRGRLAELELWSAALVQAKAHPRLRQFFADDPRVQ